NRICAGKIVTPTEHKRHYRTLGSGRFWTFRSRPAGDSISGSVGVFSVGFQEDSHAAELLVAIGQEFVGGLADQIAKRAEQINFEPERHLMVVAMGAAERLVDDVVDDFEVQ